MSLPHFAESLVRAYKIAMTPPIGPVAIVADGHLQEAGIGDERFAIPRFTPTEPPRGDDAAVREAARLLVAAEAPVIVADRIGARSERCRAAGRACGGAAGPVVDLQGRMNFPNGHYLNQRPERARRRPT